MLKATACSVWPEGKLNSSSGATGARMRASEAHGRGRLVHRFNSVYSDSAMTPVAARCNDACSPCSPSNSTIAAISAYQNTPSPSRLTQAK